MTIWELFKARPDGTAGSGDPYLWDALGWELSRKVAFDAQTDIALCKNRFDEDVTSLFEGLVGEDLTTTQSTVQVDWLPERAVCVSKWQEKLLPELLEKSHRFVKNPRQIEEYHPAEHRFRFAAWCAATAARSSRSVCTFSVERGADLLRNSSVRFLALGPHWLPLPDQFDDTHDRWCTDILEGGKATISPDGFSYGIAAKMVNCFLKTLFLADTIGRDLPPAQPAVGDCSDRAAALHPPIDRVLLDALQKQNVGNARSNWRTLKNKGWSKFDRETYQEAINLMKENSNGRLAQLEAFWVGYQ